MPSPFFKRVQDLSRMNRDVASQAEAEAGLNNEKAMTPLRVFQALATYVAGVVAKITIRDDSTPAAARVLLDLINNGSAQIRLEDPTQESVWVIGLHTTGEGDFSFEFDGVEVVRIEQDGGIRTDSNIIADTSVQGAQLKTPVIAFSALPAAAAAAGSIVATSDGGTAGIPALMYSNGTVWVVAAE